MRPGRSAQWELRWWCRDGAEGSMGTVVTVPEARSGVRERRGGVGTRHHLPGGPREPSGEGPRGGPRPVALAPGAQAPPPRVGTVSDGARPRVSWRRAYGNPPRRGRARPRAVRARDP